MARQHSSQRESEEVLSDITNNFENNDEFMDMSDEDLDDSDADPIMNIVLMRNVRAPENAHENAPGPSRRRPRKNHRQQNQATILPSITLQPIILRFLQSIHLLPIIC